jgi:hypothetical protein
VSSPDSLGTAACLLALAACACDVAGVEERLDFDQPESWAMAYTAAAFAPSPSRAPEDEPCGSVLVGADATYWRRLSTREERVGFDGTAPEAMNRSPLLGDVRLEAGLPGAVEAALSWTPPVDVRGVRADVVALALRRPLWREAAWRFDLRAYGTLGHVSGDITSDRDTATSAPGSAGNPLSVDGESHDALNWRAVGAAALATRTLDERRSAVFAGLEGAYLSATFHVRAQELGVDDRTVLATRGLAWGGVLGGSTPVAQGLILGAAFEYVPLRIARPNARAANDPFATARISLTARL